MAIRNIIVRGYGPGASIAFVTTRGYTIGTGPPTAVVGVSAALTEPLVVNGGQTITITLSQDTWVPAGAAFNAQRQSILNGLTSAQSEVTGWNKKVRDKQPVTAVVRTSNTLVTVTLIVAPSYNITVNEVITVIVPDEALISSTTPLVATPTIGITATVALLLSHVLRFTSASRSTLFSSAPRRTTFQSLSNATITFKGTVQPLGFILLEDGGNLLQENDLNIAQE